MSSLRGVAAATSAPPVENWGALRWAHRPKSESVVKREEGESKNGHTHENQTAPSEEVVLQLVSLLKPKHISSGTPASAVEKPILQIPISSIATASATTRNDLTLTMRPQSSITSIGGNTSSSAVPMELTSVRFAIPNICVDHEQSEEGGREILAEVHTHMREEQTHTANASGPHADEQVVAVLDDLTFSYPAGRFKLTVSNCTLALEDKRRAAGAGTGALVGSVPLSDVLQLYLCDIPSPASTEAEGVLEAEMAQYVVLILRNPLKIRTTTYNHMVISCPAGFALDAAHPWECVWRTQEEIDRLLAALPHNRQTPQSATPETGTETPSGIRNSFTPTMHGRVSEMLIRILKAMTGVSALGGRNRDYQTTQLGGGRHSVLRCLHHGSEGFLFVLNAALLFLHRPVTRAMYTDITRVEVDESESGTATFQLVVYGTFGASRRGGEEKIVFSALDKKEKTALLAYLERKVHVKRIGTGAEDDDEDDEDDEDDDAEEDEEDEEDMEDEEEEDEDEEDEEAEGRKHRKRHRSNEKREKAHKKHKKDRHDGGDREHGRKHKKDKKKDKKDKKKHKKERKEEE